MKLMQKYGGAHLKTIAQSRAEAVEFHVPCHSELLCISLRCSALLCASMCPLIFQPHARRNATSDLILSLQIKFRHGKHVVENSYLCVFVHEVPPQDGPGSSSYAGWGSRQSRKVQSCFPPSSSHLPSIGPAHTTLPHGIWAESSLVFYTSGSQRWV